MTDARVHALTTEVLGAGTPTARTHGLAVEVLGVEAPPSVDTVLELATGEPLIIWMGGTPTNVKALT